MSKEKKYVSDIPELLVEWDYEKNDALCYYPDRITTGSSKKVWWKCKKCNNTWLAAISSRARKSGCPYCSGRKAIPGVNDLFTLRPDLQDLFDYDRNTVDPLELKTGSGISVWWKCNKCGASYKQRVDHKTNGIGCPYCSNRKANEDNSLLKLFPEIASEFDIEKNNTIPSKVVAYSNKKYYWKCRKCNGSWKTSVNNRTSSGTKCPYCAGQKVLIGYNDFQTKQPALLKEWDYEKNGNILPNSITEFSGKKVWWKCANCGNSWQASVRNRSCGAGCPQCAREMQSSFPEQAIYYYIKSVYKDAINGYKSPQDGITEIDIFIPSIRLGIEYDGSFYHRDVNKDIRKYETLKSLGIKLIRVIELSRLRSSSQTSKHKLDDHHIYYTYDSKLSSFDKMLDELFSFLNIVIDHNIERDRIAIHEQFLKLSLSQSLLMQFPEIAKEWDYDKNGGVKPDNISPVTGKRFWFICSKGHSYLAIVSDRTHNKSGCPYCANQRVLAGYNDLASCYPDIAKEWSLKNDKRPTEVIYGTQKKYIWNCLKCGKEYVQSVYRRIKGFGCPNCAKEKNRVSYISCRTIEGVNDLPTLRPDLIEEWDYEKNELKPSLFSVSSGFKAWWRCKKCGYSWQSTINKRTKYNRGCPKCNGGIGKTVLLIDSNGVILKEYESIMKAANDLGVSRIIIDSRIKSQKLINGGHLMFKTQE